MPNYGLVINSKFRPFSYQEMLAPVQQSTEAHQALENAYEELNTNASIWEGLANKESDPITYQRYKNFADALKTQADELATNGLNPTSRQAVSNLRARYASDIIPIKNAYEKRQADIKAQQEILLKDPTHFFDKKASETSLDEYLTNDKLDVLSDQYSGALLRQQVGQIAQAYKNTLTDKGALSRLGLPFQYERKLQSGASVDDVLKAMSEDPNALPFLTKIVDDVLASSGIMDWSTMQGDWRNNKRAVALYEKARGYAREGLSEAIGTSKIEHFTDSYSMQNALAQQDFNRKLAAAETKKKNDAKSMIDPVNLYNNVRNDKRADWEKQGIVVNKDGKYYLADKGKQYLNAYNQALSKFKGNADRLESYLRGTSEEKSNIIIDKKGALNGLLLLQDLQDLSTKSGKDLNIMQLKTKGSNDIFPTTIFNDAGISELLTDDLSRTIHSQTAYRYQIGKEDSDDVLGTILSDYGQGKYLDIMKYDSKSQSYKKSGTLNRNDLSDYRINNIQVSKAGNIVELLDEDNKTTIIRLPNSRNAQRLDIVLNNISALQNQMSSLDPSSTGYAQLEEILENQEATIYQIISDNYRKNKSKNQEFNANSVE